MRARPASDGLSLQRKTAGIRLLPSLRLLGSAFTGMCLLLAIAGCEEKEKAPPPLPPEVEVTDVIQRDVPVYQEWVAQLNGQVNADITPKVQGYVLSKNYSEGFFVRKGQLLYEIDPRPFIASLDQAKATVAVAVAQQSEAENNVTRDRPLAAQNAIPQKQLDTDVSNLAATTAQVNADKANMAQAELNLAWTKVLSPIDGLSGISNSNVGDLVGTTTKMTTVSQVNPIRAYFNISESDYLGRAQMIARVVRGGGAKAVPLPVEFVQTNGATLSREGQDHSCEPGGDFADGHDSTCCRVSKQGRHTASWRIWQRSY